MDDIVKEFLDEAGEHLEMMNKNLLAMEKNIAGGVDKDVINTIFRSAHSLKGVSGMLGFMIVSKLTHRMENVFDGLRSDRIGITPDIVDALFKGLDKLEALLKGIREKGKEDVDIAEYVSSIEEILGQRGGDKIPASQKAQLNISKDLSEKLDSVEESKVIEKLNRGDGKVYEITMRLNRDCFDRGVSPIDFYKDIESLGEVISVAPVNLKPLPIDVSVIKEYDIEIIMLLSTGYNPDYIRQFLGNNDLKINNVGKDAEDKDKGVPPFDISKYFQPFIEETEEEIGRLNHEILKLENIKGASEEALGGDSMDTLNEIFRLCHRIKGASSAMGYKSLSEIAHDGETILSKLRDGGLFVKGEVIDCLLKMADFFHNSIERIKAEKNPVIVTTEIKEMLNRFVKNGGDSIKEEAAERKPLQMELSEYNRSVIKEAVEKGYRIFRVDVFFKDRTPLGFERAFLIKNNLDEMGNLIKCEPDLEKGEGDINQISILISTETDVNAIRKAVDVDMVEFVNIEPFVTPNPRKIDNLSSRTPNPEPRTPNSQLSTPNPNRRDSGISGRRVSDISQASSGAQSIRVDISRLNNLMNLTGELVISRARINQFGISMKDVFDQQRIFSLLDNINSSLGRFKTLCSTPQNPGSMELETRNLELYISGLEAEIKRFYRKRTVLLDLMEEINNMGRLTMGVQNGVMKSRMVSVGQVFNRFERIVRDLAKDRGKEVKLEIAGEETELDKKVIDELGDPLTHMVRNSIDHGIEPAEEREKIGKDRTAVLKLDASRRGNYICIEVSDDGRGIDVDSVRKKVLEKGLSEPERVSKMTEKELIDFIFLPGFSTASKITDISGRGVGLDVVRQKIDGLGGQVEIVTEKGKGTKFLMKLPLTLAIVPALLSKADNEIYSIPLESVIEIVRFKMSEIHKLDDNYTAKLRGRVITIAPLCELLNPSFNGNGGGSGKILKGEKLSPSIPAYKGRTQLGEADIATTVIVGLQERRLGIVVDSLLGEQDIVIKSLGDHFSNVVGISGASILGNGEISLILDIPALIKQT